MNELQTKKEIGLRELNEMKSELDDKKQQMLKDLNEEIKTKLEKQLRLVFSIEFLEDYEKVFEKVFEDSFKKMNNYVSRLVYYDSKFHHLLISQYLQDTYIKDDELLLFLIYWCINNKKIVILRSICLLVDPIRLSRLLLAKNNIIYLVYPAYNNKQIRKPSPFLFAISLRRLRIVKLFSSFIKLTNIAFSQTFPVEFSDSLIENEPSKNTYDDYNSPEEEYSSILYEPILNPEVDKSIFDQYSKIKKRNSEPPSRLFGGRKSINKKKSKRYTKKLYK